MNTTRIYQLVRWNVIIFRSQLIRLFLVAISIMLILGATHYSLWMDDAVNCSRPGVHAPTWIVIAMILMFAANICLILRTKAGFLSYIMLPASNKEKFIALFLFATFVETAVWITGLAIGDGLQVGITTLRYGTGLETSRMLAVFEVMIARMFPQTVSALSGALSVMLWMSIISLHAMFTLYGTCFRKHRSIYAIILLIMMMFVSIGVGGFFEMIFTSVVVMVGCAGSTNLISDDMAGLLVCIALLAGIICLMYLLAYRSFCRSQIISNR